MSEAKDKPVDIRDVRGRVGKDNKLALKHGVYCPFTPEERAEREEYERQLTEDLGGNPSTAQRSIIRRASWLEVKLRKNERASMEGQGEIAQEHCLSWVNSQRLLLCALGLERKQRPGPSLQDYLAAKAREKAEAEKAQVPQKTADKPEETK